MFKKIIFIASIILITVFSASAQRDYKIYPWENFHRGWMEVGIRSDRIFTNADRNLKQFFFGRTRESQGLSLTTANLEYGFSERLMIGLNTDFVIKGSIGANLYRLRANALYRLSDKYSHSFASSLFVEYSIPNSLTQLPTEIELKLILTKEWGDFQFDFNPSLVQALSGTAEVRHSALAKCNIGVYWRRHWGFQPGIEYFGEFGEIGHLTNQMEQLHELFAVANYRFSDDFLLNIGIGHGLTDASETVVGKIGIRYQFSTISPREQAW